MNKDEIMSSFDEDEIDLLKIIDNQDGSKNQYVVFKDSKKQSYAIHIEYIQEIVRFNEEEFISYLQEDNSVIGTVNFKNQVYLLVDFDLFSIETRSKFNNRQLIMILVLNEERVALLVEEVCDLVQIYENQITKNIRNDEKYSEVANLVIENEIEICKIINFTYLYENI